MDYKTIKSNLNKFFDDINKLVWDEEKGNSSLLALNNKCKGLFMGFSIKHGMYMSGQNKENLWNHTWQYYHDLRNGIPKQFYVLKSTHDKKNWPKMDQIMSEYLISKHGIVQNIVIMIAKEIDYNIRINYLRSAFDQDYTPFYLMSFNVNCKTNHREEQGKIFIDARFDPTVDPKILDYCRMKMIKPVQSVIFGPPYMISRPYCRHLIKPIPIEDVLTLSIKQLLLKYDLLLMG